MSAAESIQIMLYRRVIFFVSSLDSTFRHHGVGIADTKFRNNHNIGSRLICFNRSRSTGSAAADYQNAMSLIQDQFEQDVPYICLYWRAGALLSRSAFTDARDIRELELLRGVESYSN